jgi:hypothetical protein
MFYAVSASSNSSGKVLKIIVAVVATTAIQQKLPTRFPPLTSLATASAQTLASRWK